jgi:Leucine-rich repeat (LRR) protein
LDQNYPKKKRRGVKNLDIKSQNLEGFLNLNDFVNLEELDCSGNKLSGLDLINCDELRKIDCKNNQLTYLDLTNLGKLEILWCQDNCLEDLIFPFRVEQLIFLNIKNNNLSARDLSDFGKFINLKGLAIGN